MTDIFDHKILCKKCNKELEKSEISRHGFILRTMKCPVGHETIVHPLDKEEYNRFVNLKNKEFNVKMRMDGNSYAVSIPMEIVNFMHEQEKIMDDMVKLCFEDFGKLSLNFGKLIGDKE